MVTRIGQKNILEKISSASRVKRIERKKDDEKNQSFKKALKEEENQKEEKKKKNQESGEVRAGLKTKKKDGNDPIKGSDKKIDIMV